MKKSVRKILIALHFATMSIDELITFISALILNFTGDPDIPVPVVTLIILGGQLTDLQTTHTARVTDKAVALTKLEQDRATIVVNSATMLAHQVEDIGYALHGGDDALGIAFVRHFGYKERKKGGKTGREFEVVSIGAGFVKMRTKAAEKKALYIWQFSATPTDAASWLIGAITNTANVKLTELTRDTRMYFRVAVISDQGRNPSVDVSEAIVYTDPISAMVS